MKRRQAPVSRSQRAAYPDFTRRSRPKERGTCGVCGAAIVPGFGRVWRDPETGLLFHHDCAVREYRRASSGQA